MRIFRLPYVLLAAAFLVIGLGAGTVRVLQLDWYANHKALNTRLGHIDWIKYGIKRGIFDLKQKIFQDDRIGLPQVRLYFPVSAQQALMENPPDSTKQWRQAFMVYPNGSLERVRVRYRGDNPTNWLFTKKSIRVKTRKKRLLGKRRVLNYSVPQSPVLMELYLAFQAAKDAGVLTLNVRLVEMFVNDEPYGVLMESDQPSEVFLRRSSIMPVNLYKGEQAHIERSEDVELDLFNNPALWKKVSVGNDLPEDDFSDLGYFLDLIRLAANDDEAYGRLKRVAPFSVWARVAAYQSLIQNAHNDGFHNQRLLADPWRGEVRPILNDPEFPAYITAPDKKLEIDTQSLLRVYNRDPAFTLEKYRLLYGFLKKDKILTRVRERIAKTLVPLLISAGRDGDIWQQEIWPGFPFKGPSEKLRGLLGEYSSKIDDLERWLIEKLEAEPVARWQNSNGRIVLGLSESAPLNGITFRLSPGSPAPGRIAWDSDGDGRLGPGDMIIPMRHEGRTLTLDAAWLANRPMVNTATYRQTSDYPGGVISRPVPTRFNLVADVPLSVAGVKGRNALTGQSFDLERAAVVGAWPSRRNRPITPPRQPQPQIWRGEMMFNGTTFFDSPVRIEPGTRIRMGPDARLIFRNRVVIAGTASAPVVVTPAEAGKPFGLIALQGPGTAGSNIRNLHMNGGTGGRIDNVQYTAMLNIHNTRDIELSGLKLSDNRTYDDMLHIVYGDDIRIEGIELKNAFSDAVDIDMSKNVRFKGGVISGAGNDGIDLMASTVVIEGMTLAGNKDKGISVGEATDVLVKETRLEGNFIGIESKDGSLARVEDVDFVANKTHLNAYGKNWRYGAGGRLEVRRSSFTGPANVIEADKKSAIRITDSQMAPLIKPGKGVVFDNVGARP